MIKRLLVGCLLTASALMVVIPRVQAQDSPEPRVLGYHAWWMAETWKAYDLSVYDKIYFFELRITPEGDIEDPYGWPDAWGDLTSSVHSAGGKIAPTFAILDPAIFSSIMTSGDRQRRLRETILDAVRDGGADGAHLNFEVFEAVDPAARDGYTRFVRALSADLKRYRADAELTVFLPGFDHGETYDEAALAGAADYLVVQGYDMHWLDGPEAGPVAPVAGWNGANWNSIIERYRSLGVSPRDMVLTVPYFGYEWPTMDGQPGSKTRGIGQPITYARVDPSLLPLIPINAKERIAAHGLQRDPISDSPFYRYRGDDGWYQGWFEDAVSLRSKYEQVRRRGLGGVAVFLLGYDGQELEPELRRVLR